jgi:hypothetical protein
LFPDLETAGLKDAPAANLLFRSTVSKSRVLTDRGVLPGDLGRMVKRWLERRQATRAPIAAFLAVGDHHRSARSTYPIGCWPAILPPLSLLSRLSLGPLADDVSACVLVFRKPDLRQLCVLSQRESRGLSVLAIVYILG